jgi:hypothetical protein
MMVNTQVVNVPLEYKLKLEYLGKKGHTKKAILRLGAMEKIDSLI